jgi:hypothetical protein
VNLVFSVLSNLKSSIGRLNFQEKKAPRAGERFVLPKMPSQTPKREFDLDISSAGETVDAPKSNIHSAEFTAQTPGGALAVGRPLLRLISAFFAFARREKKFAWYS